MPHSKTVFEKIIDREIPAEIVYEDDVCISFATIEPHNPGHLLVVPKRVTVEWQDIPKQPYRHIMTICQGLARALRHIYNAPRISLVTVGFEVEHVHFHLIPIYTIADIDHTKAQKVEMASLKGEADKLRSYLQEYPLGI